MMMLLVMGFQKVPLCNATTSRACSSVTLGKSTEMRLAPEVWGQTPRVIPAILPMV